MLERGGFVGNDLASKIDLSGVVMTNDKCLGSNRCMRACDYFGTNSAILQADGRYSFVVDDQKCISCGACIDACTNNARVYKDDTEAFFEALKNGEEISVLVSQLMLGHYHDDYKKVLGGLKKLGVKNFISVGNGGDISAWAYINYMKKNNVNFLITQHCSATINYIVRFVPELIKHLAPVQSPIMSTAIYAKNELKIDDKLAFIGSCIAKKTEFESFRGGQRISYNVTFKHLMDYIRKNNLYDDSVEIELDHGLNLSVASKGAVSEILKRYLGDDLITRQVMGVENVHSYLKVNKNKILNGDTPYTILELGNCVDGCVYGKGIENSNNHDDDAIIRMIKMRKEAADNIFKGKTYEERAELLNERFKNLVLEDYLCEYLDISYNIDHKIPSEEEKEEIFKKLGKLTDITKNTNCACCGYNSCLDMVYAIHNGYNTSDNCIHCIKEEVLKERDKVVKAEMYKELAVRDTLTGLLNRNALNALKDEIQDLNGYGIITFDLNNLKLCNDVYGHIAGDNYIIVAANLINKAFGKFGKSYRIGGDEFLTILKDASFDEISEATKLFEELQNECNDSNEYEFEIGIPYGYAFYDERVDKSEEDTRKRADEHMYANKTRFKLTKRDKSKKVTKILYKDFVNSIEF